jgi:general secretion pathway protein L
MVGMAAQGLSARWGTWLTRAGEFASYAAAWWLNEFLALFPAKIAQRLTDPGTRNLLLRPSGEKGVSLLLRNDRGDVLARVDVAGVAQIRPAIEALLQRERLSAGNVAVGIEMEESRAFRRTFLLPQEARCSLAAIAEQDLLRKTPFRLDDIYHDHASRRVGDKIEVDQLVIRRDFVEALVRQCGLEPDDVAFIDIGHAEQTGALSRVQLKHAGSGTRWLPRLLLGLSASAVLLAALAVNLAFQRQEAALQELATETGKVRAEAQKVRAALDSMEREQAALDGLKSRKWDAAGVLDIWEELSRILPDHSWVSELRLTESAERKERRIVLTGFSSAAADLVGLIDASPLFQDVALAAPIALDPNEQRERFVLQASVTATKPVEASR